MIIHNIKEGSIVMFLFNVFSGSYKWGSPRICCFQVYPNVLMGMRKGRDLCVSCIKHIIRVGLTSIQLTKRTKIFIFVNLSHGRHLSSSLRWWWRMIRGWWEMRMMEVRDNCIFFYYIADKFDDGGTRWRISFLFKVFYFYVIRHEAWCLSAVYPIWFLRGEGTQIWCISFECLIV